MPGGGNKFQVLLPGGPAASLQLHLPSQAGPALDNADDCFELGLLPCHNVGTLSDPQLSLTVHHTVLAHPCVRPPRVQVRYDAASGRYVALTNPSIDRYGSNPDARNILVLVGAAAAPHNSTPFKSVALPLGWPWAGR
jgi:hypothetical protein